MATQIAAGSARRGSGARRLGTFLQIAALLLSALTPSVGAATTVMDHCGAYPATGVFSGESPFVFSLSGKRTVGLRTTNGDRGCTPNVRLSLYDSSSTLIAESTDYSCSNLLLSLNSGQYTVWPGEYVASEGGEVVGAFELEFFTSTCTTCGNGILEAEECDDGGLIPGDGCDSQCELHPIVACGSYPSPGFGEDGFDVFSFTLSTTEIVRLQPVDGVGGCPAGTDLALLNQFGSPVAMDHNAAEGGCSRLQLSLAAGTYSLVISGHGGIGIDPYFTDFFTKSCSTCGNGELEAEDCDGSELGACSSGPCSASCTCPLLPLCGDSIVQENVGEQCDDGNQIDGDSCDSDCHREVRELGECGSYETSGLASEDSLEFTLDLAAASIVRLETSDGEAGCPGDTAILVYDSDGQRIATNQDSGNGLCSRLVVPLEAGAYKVEVHAFIGPVGPFALEYFSEACSTCGNGIVEAEVCDDGNLVNGDGCDSNCQIVAQPLGDCGYYESPGLRIGEHHDYVFTLESPDRVRIVADRDICGLTITTVTLYLYDAAGNEIVHDLHSAYDGVCSRVEADLPAGQYRARLVTDNVLFGSYVLEFLRGACSTCGNDVVEVGERCDDGNVEEGDGCSAECEHEVTPLESCGVYPGQALGPFKQDDFSLSLDTPTTVALRATNAEAGCVGETSIGLFDSNGISVESSDDLGSQTCARIFRELPAGAYRLTVSGISGLPTSAYLLSYHTPSCSTCANGALEAEECDDGNLVPGDRCDSNCNHESTPLSECGAFSSPGPAPNDYDKFSLDLEATEAVSFRLTDGNGGCPGLAYLEVLDTTGQRVLSRIANGSDCPPVVGTLTPGLYSVEVREFFAGEVFPYTLEYFAESCSVCGNSVIELGEQCDDGNAVATDTCTDVCLDARCGDNIVGPGELCDDGDTSSGDGCDGNCSPTGCGNGIRTSGEECDDANTTAGDGCDSLCLKETVPLTICGETYSSGFEPGEFSSFSFHLDLAGEIRIETNQGDGGCAGTGIIEVYDSAQVLLASSGSQRIDGCPLLVASLPAGSFTVKLRDAVDAAMPPCFIRVDATMCSECGDEVIGVGEQCDDGNVADGDGCDADCRERIPLETCGSYETAGFGLDGTDAFRLNLESSQLVHLETTGTDSVCPGDTILEIYDAGGELVTYDDQGGEGPCSALTVELEPAVYHVVVRGFEGSEIGAYRLLYQKASCSICGNSTLEVGEQCDEGDTPDLDGQFCRSSCQRVAPCGQPQNIDAESAKVSDALFVLKSAVGQRQCDLRVCDTNDDGKIAASDALIVLRAAVGNEQPDGCPL